MTNDDQVVETIKKLYVTLPHPILLSTLGTALRNEGCAISGGIKNFIDDKLAGFTTIQNSKVKERIAIASEKDYDKIRQVIENVDLEGNEYNRDIEVISNMYRSVLYAFCSKVDQDTYLSIKYPFKYTLSPMDGEEGYKKIKSDDKLDLRLPSNLKKLPQEDANKLTTKIKEWCNSNDVDISSFVKRHYVNEKGRLDNRISIPRLLIDFIESQPEHIKKELIIPCRLLIKD